jgi:hypothetical protein
MENILKCIHRAIITFTVVLLIASVVLLVQTNRTIDRCFDTVDEINIMLEVER